MWILFVTFYKLIELKINQISGHRITNLTQEKTEMKQKRKIVFCYPSLYKENEGIDILYGPLALAYLAAHTPDNYDLSLYDEYVGENLNPETIKADIVAFSSITSGINRAYQLADILRKRGICCVLGGAHGTALTDEALEHFDVVVKGEGEAPWLSFLKDYENGKIKPVYQGKMNISLKTLGVPDRRFIHANYPYPSLMTSRGCPFHCTFCYLSIYTDRKYRTIPHETVLEDMENLRNEKLIIITDENFIGYGENDYKNRRDLLRKMITRNFQFIWGCQASVNIAFQPELLKLMYQAGCRAIFIGYETNNTSSLEFLNKKHNLKLDYKKVVKNIHREKMAVIASTILGLDDQKKNYHYHLIKDLKRIKVDLVRVFYITAWPGTPFYTTMEKQNRIFKKWGKLRKDIPTFKYKHYSQTEIIEARNEVVNTFYKKSHMIRIILRWILKDRSLLKDFLHIRRRNITSEKIRNQRALKSLKVTD